MDEKHGFFFQKKPLAKCGSGWVVEGFFFNKNPHRGVSRGFCLRGIHPKKILPPLAGPQMAIGQLFPLNFGLKFSNFFAPNCIKTRDVTVLVSPIYPLSQKLSYPVRKNFFDDFSGRKGGRKKGDPVRKNYNLTEGGRLETQVR